MQRGGEQMVQHRETQQRQWTTPQVTNAADNIS